MWVVQTHGIESCVVLVCASVRLIGVIHATGSCAMCVCASACLVDVTHVIESCVVVVCASVRLIVLIHCAGYSIAFCLSMSHGILYAVWLCVCALGCCDLCVIAAGAAAAAQMECMNRT